MEQKKRVLILGGEGIGMIAAWIIDRVGDAEVIGLINDVYPVGSQVGRKKKYEVIGNSDDVKRYIDDGKTCFIIAFHGMKREKATYEKIQSFNIPINRFYSAIDPTAIIAYDYSEIGAGIIAAPYSQIGPDCIIGNNSVILGNSFIGHDTTVGKFCHIASNAVIGAHVHIGNACHIGLNSAVREFVKIGDYSLVGMGSVVLKDVDTNSIVAGNPAKLLRKKD